MNLRLYNARIYTMEKNREIFEGEIWIKNDRIAYIEDYSNSNPLVKASLPPLHLDLEIDCHKNLLMPGFKNAHTHSGMSFLRSFADDLPLDRWLNEKVFPMEAKLTEDDIYDFARLSILEYLSSGITSIFDMYISADATAQASIDMGMRLVLNSGLNNFTSSLKQMEDEYIRLNKLSPLVTYRFGFHAEYTCSKDLIAGVASLSHQYKAPVSMHLCETQKEVKDCMERYGTTPLVFLDNMGIFDYGGTAYHMIYVTEQEMDIIQRKRIGVVTNPSSNLKLSSGIAPIADYVKRNIPIGIGTDGPASNNCLDMFREMFLVSGLSKLREEDAASLDACEVLRMAISGGAKVMGLKNCDVLARGKQADMILINLSEPNMQPIHNIPKNLVYSGSKTNVLMTMIAGKILFYEGKYNLSEHPEMIYEKCNQRIRRLLCN